MRITIDLIKELRNLTGASIAHCKKALEETGGDIQKAIVWLRKYGLEVAARKKDQGGPQEGRIEAYVHHDNKIGALLQVSCETDFVARGSDFLPVL